MEKFPDNTFFEHAAGQMVDNRSVFGALLCVEDSEGTISWSGSAGNIRKEDSYFIASVTKMYVTAVVLSLREEGRLNMDDPVYSYFPDDMLAGLHVLNGVEYTKDITITHLISNTSGLPDYFSGETASGKPASSELLAGKDDPWPLEKILAAVKTMKPRFRPGRKGKAHYSDTNYELLGAVIEKITGKHIGDVFKEYIFDRLGLQKTYAYRDIEDRSPIPMYYRKKQLNVPRYIASVTAEGGIVSTAEEVMIFLKAFFSGCFFPPETIEELKKWNFICFPGQFYYGIGLEKLWIPRIMSPFKETGEILGFWGQSGAFAFYNPLSGLFFTGTVNQLSGFGHSKAIRAMIKIINAALRR